VINHTKYQVFRKMPKLQIAKCSSILPVSNTAERSYLKNHLNSNFVVTCQLSGFSLPRYFSHMQSVYMNDTFFSLPLSWILFSCLNLKQWRDETHYHLIPWVSDFIMNLSNFLQKTTLGNGIDAENEKLKET